MRHSHRQESGITRAARRRAGAAALLAVALGANGAAAGSLLDPTPQAALRPLSTDRPDVTESPYTVDAGHVQVEADAFSFSHHEAGGLRIDELRLAQMNVKLGLSGRVDLQVVAVPYVKTSLEYMGFDLAETVESGDLTFRLKVNLAGNDGGPVAVALLPFVSPPTGSAFPAAGDREPAFGLAVPVAMALPHAFGLGLMAQVAAQDEDRAYLMTGSLGRALGGGLGGFLEIAAERVDRPDQDPLFSPTGPTDFWNTTLNTGLTLGVTPDLQIDAAVQLGLTEEAPDWTAYTGISVRR
jgi:hypothetical protein